MLENLRSFCELTVVRSLLKRSCINLLIGYNHEQSD
jgi:hypothetical protein